MQVPNLTGHIVYVTEGGSPVRVFVCTDHQPTYLKAVPVEGGLYARMTTLPLSQYTLLGFAYSETMVGQLFQSVLNVLNADMAIKFTDDGIASLMEARDALGVLVRQFADTNTREEREAFDAEVRASREAEDAARDAFFENLGSKPQAEPELPPEIERDIPAIAGATFTERPWTQQTAPQSLGEPESVGLGGTQVRVYIVVEHENQAIVEKVTAAIRHQIHTAIG